MRIPVVRLRRGKRGADGIFVVLRQDSGDVLAVGDADSVVLGAIVERDAIRVIVIDLGENILGVRLQIGRLGNDDDVVFDPGQRKK